MSIYLEILYAYFQNGRIQWYKRGHMEFTIWPYAKGGPTFALNR